MAELTVLKNQQAILDLASDFVNTGWSVSGDALVHDPCNAGFIRNNAIETIPGEEYTIKFTVEGWVSGMVQAIVGGENAPAVSANGDYEHVVVADDDGVVIVPRGAAARVADSARSRVEKETHTRAVLASGKLGLDHYGMRETLRAKGLRYVDTAAELN